MSILRVVIVDDERPARQKVRRFLLADPQIEIIGEAGSGAEAVARIRETAPDLIFLDVQMPPPDGFGVLEALRESGTPLPHVVFTTAYDTYAVRAFEVHAVDYLLKPFDAGRFEQALARAKAAIRSTRAAGLDERLSRLLEEVRPRRGYLERLLVDRNQKSFLLRLEAVDWIEAARNYVTLHAGGESYLVRGTLTQLERQLDPGRFIRIHRSRIVNVDRIAELHPWSHGDWLVVLTDGTRLMLSRRYRDRLPTLASG